MIREMRVLQWGNTFQFLAPPMTQTNPRKRAPGKIRARWSNKARYNPMKMKRPNTPDIPVTKMDTTDSGKMKVPLSVKVCDRFGPMCQFCKQSAPHPSPQESDWTDEDGDLGTNKNTKTSGDTNLLSDWNLTSPQYNPNSKPEGTDKININKLSIDPNNPQEELLQVTNSFILPPTMDEEKTTTQKKMVVGTDNNQHEGEEYKV